MINSEKKYVIAIDGEPGTGKSTLAKTIARKLGIVYVDTGAMYRAVGLYFLQQGIEATDANMKEHQHKIHIGFQYEGENLKVILNDQDVTDAIRSTEASKMASCVSRLLSVREYLVDKQRQMADEYSFVMDGQDIGTVVFPNANLKIYLTANMEERAKRRQKDLVAKGEEISVEQVKQDLIQRAKADLTRKNSPIRKAEDAYELDSTANTPEELAERVIILLQEKR